MRSLQGISLHKIPEKSLRELFECVEGLGTALARGLYTNLRERSPSKILYKVSKENLYE